jgi:hypothetical protein
MIRWLLNSILLLALLSGTFRDSVEYPKEFLHNPSSSQIVEKQVILDVPFYSQRDDLWEDDLLGNSKSLTISSDGCGITSAAMLLRYYDLPFSPPNINTAFADADGFTGALMYWGSEPAWDTATDHKILGVTNRFSSDQTYITQNLDHGRPVIVFLNGQHYVVITGYEVVVDDQDSTKKTTKFFINDPWAETPEAGKGIRLEDNVLKKKTNFTQMIVLHTDPKMPVDGFLVDWPAIQARYQALGGLEGVLGKPLEDDRKVANDRSFVEIREQYFDGGRIVAYQYEDSADWIAYWMPQAISRVYSLEQHGLVNSDTYTNVTFNREYLQRLDTETASFTLPPASTTVQVVTEADGITTEYFDNPNLSGPAKIGGYEEFLNFDWQDGPPHPDLPAQFSARFTLKVHVGVPWWTTFTIIANGGMRSALDGKELVDRWDGSQSGSVEITRFLGSGDHEWVIEYRNNHADPFLAAADSAWPARIVWADEEKVGSFDILPDYGLDENPPTPTQSVPLPLPTQSEPILLPTVSPETPPTEPGTSFWDEWLQSLQDWFDQQGKHLSEQFSTWLENLGKDLQRILEQQIQEWVNSLLKSLEDYFNQLLQGSCGSVSLVVVPVVVWVIIRKGKR